MDWFKGFAGIAFSWQDTETPLHAPVDAPVFAVVPSEADEGDVVLFSR
jgi:hypothetical protein